MPTLNLAQYKLPAGTPTSTPTLNLANYRIAPAQTPKQPSFMDSMVSPLANTITQALRLPGGAIMSGIGALTGNQYMQNRGRTLTGNQAITDPYGNPIPQVGFDAQGNKLGFGAQTMQAVGAGANVAPYVAGFGGANEVENAGQQTIRSLAAMGSKSSALLGGAAAFGNSVTQGVNAGNSFMQSLPGVAASTAIGAGTGALFGAGLGAGTGALTQDPTTSQFFSNLGDQEKFGIPSPASTPRQLNQSAEDMTWNVIKPKLTPSELTDAAASGQIVRTGENGVVTQVPTKSDQAAIKLAQPYVQAANGDPIQTAVNIKNGIATEAQNLRTAVGTRGGTFSTSNIQGVLNDVNIPLAIRNTTEMTTVNNINDYVASLADKVDKNPSGALDLAQQFRSGINNEFGENVWGKQTPIGSYIKNVNSALNKFISQLLPDGELPDGTTIADSFKKQSQLYDILGNIQTPPVGDAAVTPTPPRTLKIPGSPLQQTMQNHPVITGAAKAAGRALGIGAGVHLIP
jgi:hypothetical protein